MSRDTIPVGLIDPDPEQPRQRIDPAALAELAASIGANGLASPILVRPDGDRYRIVHGERRWRAATELGWAAIPAEVRDLDDEAARWLQLAENLGRHDLSPIEEARAYRAMLDRGETHAGLAARLGKDRSVISQKLRLLDLPAPLTLLVDERVLTEGHVRQLLRVKAMYTDRHTIGGPDDPGGRLGWADLWADTAPEGRVSLSFLMLRAARPEDWPTGYPFQPDTDSPAVGAAEVLALDVERHGGAYPMWALVAWWFAMLTVVHRASVATLKQLIDAWIERILAALVYARDIHDLPRAAEGEPLTGLADLINLRYWCHRHDLRHAGLAEDNAHLDIERTLDAFRDGRLALPSECQPGGPMYERYRELEQQDRERRAAAT